VLRTNTELENESKGQGISGEAIHPRYNAPLPQGKVYYFFPTSIPKNFPNNDAFSRTPNPMQAKEM